MMFYISRKMRLGNQRQNMIVRTLVINYKHENTCSGNYWNTVSAPDWKLSDINCQTYQMMQCAWWKKTWLHYLLLHVLTHLPIWCHNSLQLFLPAIYRRAFSILSWKELQQLTKEILTLDRALAFMLPLHSSVYILYIGTGVSLLSRECFLYISLSDICLTVHHWYK